MTDLVNRLRALANPDRLAILAMLRDHADHTGRGPNVSQIATSTELNRFSASRHLAILESAGWLVRERVGGAIFHTLRVEAFDQIDDWLVSYLDTLVPSTIPLAKAGNYE